MNTISNKIIYIEFAKFIQNILLENNIECYLIGGSLINAVRDDGVLLSDDIDFAIVNEENLDKVFKILNENAPTFIWTMNDSVISIYLYEGMKLKIDLFLFVKRNLNYYLKSYTWLNEKIYGFQTFKKTKVILENKEFYTIFRPDIFLKIVYGDYSKPKKDYYPNTQGGDTQHVKECIFYTSVCNYDKVDFQVENLKLFFQIVSVKRNYENIDDKKINIFDSSRINIDDTSKVLIYKDFINYYVKNNIKYFDV